MTIKCESIDIDDYDVEDPTFNAMEDAFEGMIRSFEQSVDEEAKQSAVNSAENAVQCELTSTKNAEKTVKLLRPKQELVERDEDEIRYIGE